MEGCKCIDFADGTTVLNTDYLRPRVIAAVQERLGKPLHTRFQALTYEPHIELTEEITRRMSGDFPRKTPLVTSDSKAVENIVRIARAATGRVDVITFTDVYHGRTTTALGLAGKVTPYSAGTGLMPGSIFRALTPHELHDVSEDDSITNIERIFRDDAQS